MLTMPVSILAVAAVLVALAATLITFVLVDQHTDRLRHHLRTVEQQLNQVLALANQERAVAGALNDAALAAQRQMLREAVAARPRLGKEVT